MNIVFFGTSEFGLPALAVLKNSHSLAAIVSTPDKPSGRNLRMRQSPVKRWAAVNDIRCLDYLRENASLLIAQLQEMRPDLFVVIAFGGILPADLLTLPRLYSLNVHASLLPKYRGAAPMQYALLKGDKETGVSVMRMIERLDAGDVLLKKKIAVGPDENIQELGERLSILGAETLMETLGQIEHGNAKFTVQDEAQATYTKKISKSDGKIDWRLPASEIHDRVRAFAGWPGSHFFFRGKRIVVWRTELSAPVPGTFLAPGTVMDLSQRDGLAVAAGGGTSLCLRELQLEGKKQLLWREFAKGFALQAGDVLE